MKYILQIFLLLLFTISYAQQSVEFEKLSSEKGISQSVIYSLQQDDIGNIWIASEEGVIKYNSSYSKTYNKYKGLPKEVGNRINTIFIDSKNRIWIGTESGICLYDPGLDKFNFIKPEASQKVTLVKKIIEDRQGKIWIGTFNGLLSYDPTSSVFTSKRIIQNNQTPLNIQALHYGIDEKILIGASTGLYVFDVELDKLEHRLMENRNILSIERNKRDYLIGV